MMGFHSTTMENTTINDSVRYTISKKADQMYNWEYTLFQVFFNLFCINLFFDTSNIFFSL